MEGVGRVFNFNVGLLGHVDSGKTAIARALSTTASTAAFDKNPQSRERGITLDLGFSSFLLPLLTTTTTGQEQGVGEENGRSPLSLAKHDFAQITVVDCPGHASLFRTVIGGSQIIDLVVLVVDATKGVQTQTAECLLLAEIACPERMIVAVNKCDLLEPKLRDAALAKLDKRLRKVLERTSFAGAPIVAVSACPCPQQESNAGQVRPDIENLLVAVRRAIYLPDRTTTGADKFLMAVDHCFSIRGQGTILTGTILNGAVKIGQEVEIPSVGEVRKIKSMQMFRQPVGSASKGDRIGLCVTQLDAKLFERGLICTKGAVPWCYAAVGRFEGISYYKKSVASRCKFHVTIGHETVMATCSFFCRTEPSAVAEEEFRFDRDYDWTEAIEPTEQVGQMSEPRPEEGEKRTFALLRFDHAVLLPAGASYIASRLDADISQNICRLAFFGRLLHLFVEKDYAASSLPNLMVFKKKSKQATVERALDSHTLVVRGLASKEGSVEHLIGLRLQLSTGQLGIVEAGFGQSGKVKVRLTGTGLPPETEERLSSSSKKSKRKYKQSDDSQQSNKSQPPILVTLVYRRSVFDPSKTMLQ